jgi:hypothetical protein
MVEKRITVDRKSAHEALDRWLDGVEAEAPGQVGGTPGGSIITFSGVHDVWIGENDDVEYGSIRVETRIKTELDTIGCDQ